MKPFEFKWSYIGIPLKADKEGGYDVVSASSMSGGYAPRQITEALLPVIDEITALRSGITVGLPYCTGQPCTTFICRLHCPASGEAGQCLS